MTLKNNIEAIIIKWAYQIDEVLSRDSDEELNVPGINFLLTLLSLSSFWILISQFYLSKRISWKNMGKV